MWQHLIVFAAKRETVSFTSSIKTLWKGLPTCSPSLKCCPKQFRLLKEAWWQWDLWHQPWMRHLRIRFYCMRCRDCWNSFTPFLSQHQVLRGHSHPSKHIWDQLRPNKTQQFSVHPCTQGHTSSSGCSSSSEGIYAAQQQVETVLWDYLKPSVSMLILFINVRYSGTI